MAGDFEIKRSVILANLFALYNEMNDRLEQFDYKEFNLYTQKEYPYLRQMLTQEDWDDTIDLLNAMIKTMTNINRREFLKEVDAGNNSVKPMVKYT
jgi:hypothetical protein